MGRVLGQPQAMGQHSSAAVVTSISGFFLSLPIQAFRTRVQIWSDVGRYLYHCHPEQARRLVSAGSAFVADKPPNGRIWKLILTSNLTPATPPTPPSIYNFQGQRYIYRTKIRCPIGGYTNTICCFKKVDKRDRWAFVLAQTDTINNKVTSDSV